MLRSVPLQIDSDLLEAEMDHLRSRLALEQERSEVLSQRLADAEENLSAATARLNTRRVLGDVRTRMPAVALRGLC
jgi:chromosome segregation ATPase